MTDEREIAFLEAAIGVFSRYGFRRTTMGDLAQAAGLSRPALYLRYCNKERIFDAAFRHFTGRVLEEIREGAARREGLAPKLRFVFDTWAIRPYALLSDLPEARPVCGQDPARDRMDAAYAQLEEELTRILEGAAASAPDPAFTPRSLARFMTAAVRGFKACAPGVEELRQRIEETIAISLAAGGMAPGGQ